MNLKNLQDFRLFGSNYENRTLKMVGILLIVGGCADILVTILVVGLNLWAYGWLTFEVLIIFVKVVFSLEPLRQISIKSIRPMDGKVAASAKTSVPLMITTAPEYSFIEVGIQRNIVEEVGTPEKWYSCSPGVYIGQPYYRNADFCKSNPPVRYLALSGSGLDAILTLQDKEPPKEPNQALQREFLAALAEVVKANTVASPAFVSAVEQMMEGVRATMEPQWFLFGSKDLTEYLSKCKTGILWRKFV
jgi:hypothetical protein